MLHCMIYSMSNVKYDYMTMRWCIILTMKIALINCILCTLTYDYMNRLMLMIVMTSRLISMHVDSTID